MKLKRQRELKSFLFGNFVTINFLVFALMHISLCNFQYNITEMNKFGTSVSYASLPDIDLSKPVAAMQFMNTTQLQNYFMNKADYLFQGASFNVTKKSYFHQMNEISNYVKIINVQAQQI